MVEAVGLSLSLDVHHLTLVVLMILVMSVAYGHVCSSNGLLVLIGSHGRLLVPSGHWHV